MANTIFDLPDLSAFTRLDGPGLEVTGQRIEPDHAVLAYRITGEDRWCRTRSALTGGSNTQSPTLNSEEPRTAATSRKASTNEHLSHGKHEDIR